jgi:ankyrin repeat domain-containing protein 50
MRAFDHLLFKDQHGWTPLHYASLEGHLQVAELLLMAGANLNATTEVCMVLGGRVAVCGPGLTTFVCERYAECHQDGFSPLHLASAQGHLGVVEWLLNAGADRNATAQVRWI